LHQTPDVHVSLESKMSKIKEIFEQKSETPIKEKVEEIIPADKRPVTQKQRELQELALLIQAATGSINNVVETSYQFNS